MVRTYVKTLQALLSTSMLASLLSAQESATTRAQLTAADYDRAAAVLDLADLLYNETLTPTFIGESDRFWYRSDDADGARFWLVDPLARSDRKSLAFDHERLAASLSALRDEPVEAHSLPFAQIDLSEPGRVSFQVAEGGLPLSYSCTTSGDSCSAVEESASEEEADGERGGTEEGAEAGPPPTELPSPDGKTALIVRDRDLYLVDKQSGEETRVTHDGEAFHDYASQPESRTSAVTEKLMGFQRPPSGLWTPDGTHILTYRLDQREVGPMYVIQTTNLGESWRPILHTYRFPVPGDEGVATSELVVVDVESATVRKVKTEPAYTPYLSLIDFGQMWLSEDGTRGYLLRRTRGSRTMSLEEIDLATGEARTLVEESSKHLLEPNLQIVARPNVRVLDNGEVLWFSQRDGWAHLYLYDERGEPIRQVTNGTWVVRDIVHVDQDARRVYFTATGVDAGVDPYLRKLYSASLDSSGEPRLLTPEPGDHTITFSPTGNVLVDVYSRIDQPTRSRVLSSSGDVLLELEDADFSGLTGKGVDLPTPFVAKARDGKTDLYGTIIFPPDFDENAPPGSYPVIDGIYPGPQASRVAKNWHEAALFLSHDFALAQLGFIVVSVDGFGTPFRSKAFHLRSSGNLQEAGGLPDHLTALRQLAARIPQMDLDRVGIYGHSGGGFASTRAIFAYPDFYKVAVSSAGNHDQRGYLQLWGEHYHGDPEDTSYEAQANASIAHQLEGKLLLAYGAMDDNVNQALTLQVIQALTEANKDYDLIVLPEGNHGFATDRYFLRRQWDYFVRHLAGKEPPDDYVIGDRP